MSDNPLAAAFASTRAILADVKPDQYDDPTPCANWQVRDLINHIVGGSYFFAHSAANGVAPDMGAETPDFTAGDVVATYDAAIAQTLDAFGAPGIDERVIKLPWGEMPGAAFRGLAMTDTFQHGWDLARATGQQPDLDQALAEQLLAGAQRAIPDSFRSPEGHVFGPVQPIADTAPAADQLAAFLGRTV
jgi:uncharacterized protein (TIGR03086 family)